MKMVSEHKGLTEDVVIFACRVIRSMSDSWRPMQMNCS
jgi:hypothetical protein